MQLATFDITQVENASDLTHFLPYHLDDFLGHHIVGDIRSSE
jgi:hypothetical protein